MLFYVYLDVEFIQLTKIQLLSRFCNYKDIFRTVNISKWCSSYQDAVRLSLLCMFQNKVLQFRVTYLSCLYYAVYCVCVLNVLRLIVCVRDYLIGIFVFGLSECYELD